MDDKKLGTLKLVELHKVWEKENTNFTPWLAEDKNLEILGKTIGLELELAEKEKAVGIFQADIFCQGTNQDTGDESLVLIENQLKRTDHTHLGQLLTYAAGLQTVTIVWIAKEFTEEHRAALDWLNEITDEKIRFFGLQIELWKIGDSKPAPRFDIISKPNDWTKSKTKRKVSIELSKVQQWRLKYWTALYEYMQENSDIEPRNPTYDFWYYFGFGVANANLSLATSPQKKQIRVVVSLMYALKNRFGELHEQKEEIEKELGFPLEWDNESHEKSAVLKITKESDALDESDWDNQHKWLTHKTENLMRVLKPRIQKL